MTTKPRSYRKLWLSLATVITLSFLVLGYYGREIYRLAPPLPARVVTSDGAVLFTGQEIKDGQNVWQSMGGQEVGTVWGHGAYVAPDWTADWLHRECVWLLNHWAAQSGGKTYDQLDAESQAALRERLKRGNPFQHLQSARRVTWWFRPRAPRRSAPWARITRRCLATIRRCKSCARPTRFPADSIKTPERRQLINAFFFWAAWACGTERSGQPDHLHTELAARIAD